MVGELRTARARDQGGEALDERERLEEEMGRAIAPWTPKLERHASVGEKREALGCERGTGDIAAEPLELVALVVLDSDLCM